MKHEIRKQYKKQTNRNQMKKIKKEREKWKIKSHDNKYEKIIITSIPKGIRAKALVCRNQIHTKRIRKG